METEETIPFPPPFLQPRDSRSLTPVPRSATPFRPRNIAASSATSSSVISSSVISSSVVSSGPSASGRAVSESHALALINKPHVPSLEQLTEARLARMKDETFLWETPPPSAHQIVLASPAAEPGSLVPLHWRGLPLSEEFQQYALRVARGENLAPYRGPVLADGSQQLPWNESDARELRRKTRRGGGVLLAVAACLGLAAFVLPNLSPSEPYRTPEAQNFELQARPPTPTPTEKALAAAAAALEPAPTPPSEPLPALRLPPPKPAAPRASAPLASAAASSTPARPAASAKANTPAVTSPAPASAATAAAVSAALKKPAETAPHEPKSAAPAEPALDTTQMLLDKPSF